MVCIIDDREDVWGYAPNLVHVKPYVFFKNAGDINAPEKFNGGSQNKTKVDSKAQAKKDVESQSNNVQKTVNPSTERESKGELDLKPTENNPKHDISLNVVTLQVTGSRTTVLGSKFSNFRFQRELQQKGTCRLAFGSAHVMLYMGDTISKPQKEN